MILIQVAFVDSTLVVCRLCNSEVSATHYFSLQAHRKHYMNTWEHVGAHPPAIRTDGFSFFHVP